MRVTLIRHGETAAQSSIRYYGATDVPLSELGREQMRRAAAALAEERFDAVFSSSLSRSREGAAIVCGDQRRVAPIAAFDEVHFGRWEGWTRGEIAHRDPENYRLWQASPGTFDYPGGESRSGFQARVRRGLEQILATVPPGHLLMVLHRGVIGIALAELLRLSIEQRVALGIDLGSIHVVSAQNGVWQAELLNRVDHLG